MMRSAAAHGAARVSGCMVNLLGKADQWPAADTRAQARGRWDEDRVLIWEDRRPGMGGMGAAAGDLGRGGLGVLVDGEHGKERRDPDAGVDDEDGVIGKEEGMCGIARRWGSRQGCGGFGRVVGLGCGEGVLRASSEVVLVLWSAWGMPEASAEITMKRRMEMSDRIGGV